MKLCLTPIFFLFLLCQGVSGNSSNFSEALESYEKLNQALFDNDITKIKKESEDLKTKISKLDNAKALETLKYTQEKLVFLEKNDDLKKAQDAFNIVSQGMLVVLEKHLKNENYSRYYCPMVKKYWIQNISKSTKVMNPYASKSMPHCGEKVN